MDGQWELPTKVENPHPWMQSDIYSSLKRVVLVSPWLVGLVDSRYSLAKET